MTHFVSVIERSEDYIDYIGFSPENLFTLKFDFSKFDFFLSSF